MQKLWLAVGFAMLAVACGSSDGPEPSAGAAGASGAAGAPAGGSGGAVVKPVPQVNPTNCMTEIVASSSECDPDHLMVMRCSVAVQPPNFSYCVDSKAAGYGLIWCCKPSFADACGEQCD